MYLDSKESQNTEDSLSSEPPLVGVKDEEKENLQKFIKRLYPDSNLDDWYNWKWQIRKSITNSTELIRVLGYEKYESINFFNTNQLPFRITPYLAYTLINLPDNHPLYKSVIPSHNEIENIDGEKSDPLNEESHTRVRNIVHRYPDRALFLVTGFCSAYCRYCTRSHMVSKRTDIRVSSNEWEEGFKYIEEHKEIRDVIISGGDPLTLRDEQIEYILSRLRRIQHVEIIRIGTKIPVVLPMRITTELLNILKKYHPLYLSVHFTHPDEFTSDVKKACGMIADNGIIMRSQTVLLKGINDNAETIKKLMHKLLMNRVVPYYIYQCDPIPGSHHFRTTVEEGIEIMHSLRGFTSGYAIPHYVIDAPGGGGKIPILYNYVKGKNENGVVLENYEGNEYLYPDN